MSYTGGLATTFAQRHQRATDAALEAGAQELINGLKDAKPLGLTQGYTSGAFTTGYSTNAIYPTEVFADSSGRKFILVSTESPYALYWEMGHINAFTRKYEREERWYPTLIRKDEDIFNAYARVYKRFMD